jgi:hypothetical protein
MASIMAMGFPPMVGGPLALCDRKTTQKVVATLDAIGFPVPQAMRAWPANSRLRTDLPVLDEDPSIDQVRSTGSRATDFVPSGAHVLAAWAANLGRANAVLAMTGVAAVVLLGAAVFFLARR